MVVQAKPANRLIIGDVGSGKTLVALMSILTYLQSGNSALKATLMAPTEVLAVQHYEKLCELIELFQITKIKTYLVTNKQKLCDGTKITAKKMEREVLDQSFSSVWIGTQALLFLKNFEPDLVFTDEQHRFGVGQRRDLAVSSFENKQSHTAHYISMTATPIPRSLALSIYGDLQTSYVNRIQTRSPILTSIVSVKNFTTLVKPVIARKLLENQKMYVICPLVENDPDQEDQNLWSIYKAAKWLETEFPNSNIVTLHGKDKEKQNILSQFKIDPDINILVSTTVIEVGIDVAEASVILILNPERFGLAQLHQIRGRVGRNNYPENYCYLLVDEDFNQNNKRLQFLTTSQDGFEIAQEDLKLRGPGDVLGTAQSGLNNQDYILENQDYQKIRDIVNTLNWDNLQTHSPLLNKYLEDETVKLWKE